MTWLKYLGAALAAVALFVSGYKYAASIYKAEIAQLREEHALATKELTDEYREKERGQAQQLADAWDKYEKARAESADCGQTLTGCASNPLSLSVNCPEPTPLPVHLKESCLPDVQDCSQEAQDWLSDVKSWLETAQQNTTQ